MFSKSRICLLSFILLNLIACVRSSVNGIIPQFFAVSDYNNNRVLIWKSRPVSLQQAADVVLGQPDMSSTAANNTPGNPGAASAQSLDGPVGVYSDGQKLLVADSLNARVLIWNSIPTANQQPADLVLGEPDMAARIGGCSSQILGQAYRPFLIGSKLFVADISNHRIMIWNHFPTENGQAADLVLGQPDMNSNTANNTPGSPGTVSGQSLDAPSDVFSDGTRLFVADTVNRRILIWNSIPQTTQQAADIVLGQPNMASNSPNSGATGLKNPTSVYVWGQTLFVADRGNNRVLLWTSLPVADQQPADLVLGQPDMNGNSANNSPGNPGVASSQSLNFPYSVTSDGDRIFVFEQLNNRILVWNSVPNVNQQAADLVLGQPDMTSTGANTNGPSSQTFNGPLVGISNGPIFGVNRPKGY